MFHAKFQTNIPSCSGEKVDFAIFSIGDQTVFFILKLCSLIMPHVKFENHEWSGFRE